MKPPVGNSSFQPPFPIQWRGRGKRNNIFVGNIVKAKVGKLEDEVRKLFYRQMRKYFNGVCN